MPINDTEAPAYTVLLCDQHSASAVPRSSRFRVLHGLRGVHADALSNLFVLCTATHLPEVSGLLSAVNRRHQLRALFVRQDVGLEWLPQLFERAKLRALHHTLVHTDAGLPRRVLTAWAHGAEAQLVANATTINDTLLVISCEPKTYEIGFSDLPALRRISRRERASFEIAPDGSYLHWPDADIHLDLDAIRSVLDPTWAETSAMQRFTHDTTVGRAIAVLRHEAGLRQKDIPGLSERQVRRIEAGESPGSSALRLLAEAHGVSLKQYLTIVAERGATVSRQDR